MRGSGSLSTFCRINALSPISRQKTLAEAVRQQLYLGHHMVAVRGKSLAGYAGWLLTSEAIGNAWLAGRGRLVPVDHALADAAALTTVAVAEKRPCSAHPRGARP